MGLEDNKYTAVSRVFSETLIRNLIKVGTPEGTNRREVGYIPAWA